MKMLSERIQPGDLVDSGVIEAIAKLENENDVLWKKVSWAWKQIFEIPVLTSFKSMDDSQALIATLRQQYAAVANDNEVLKARLELLEGTPQMTACQVHELMIRSNMPLSPQQIMEIE